MRSVLYVLSLFCFALAGAAWGASPTLSLSPADSYFWGNTPPTLTATVTLPDAQAPATLRLLDYHLSPVRALWAGTLNGTQTATVIPPRFGVFYVEATATLPDGAQTVRRSFSWLPAPAPIWDDSPFGVGTHFMQWGSEEEQRQRLTVVKNMGATWMRDDYLWGRTEQEKGVISKPESYDRYIRLARSMGLQPILLLCYGNQFYDDGKKPTSPDGLAAYTRFCAQVTRNYDGLVSVWDTWNEPNLTFMLEGQPSAAPYIASFKAGVPAIRQVDPKLRISVGAIAGNDFPYIEEILQAGGAQYMDILSIHPYYYPLAPDVSGAVENLRKLQQMMHQYGADHAKVWITEMGYPTHTGESGVSEARSGAYIVRQYVSSLSVSNVERVMVYDFSDDGPNPEYNEHNFGIVHGDLTPKVAYGAYNTMVRTLAHRAFTRTYALGENVQCFEYTGAEGPVQVLWAVRDSAVIALKGKATGPVTLTDMQGNTTPLTAAQGSYSLVLSEEPCYIRNLTRVAAAKPAITLTGITRGWPGETSEVALQIRDKSLARRSWTLEAPDGWTAQHVAGLRFAVTPSTTAALGTHVLLARSGEATIRLPWTLSDPVTRVSQRDEPQRVHVTVANPYPTAKTITIRPQAAGRTLAPQRITLPARSSETLALDINTETPEGWSYFPVTLNVSWQGSDQPAPVTSPAKYNVVRGLTPCYQADGVTLDGDLSEWQGKKACVASAADPRDLSAKLWTGYDKQGWYLAMRIADNVWVDPEQSSNMWGQDSVQFALAAGNARYEYGVGISTKGDTLRYQWAPLGQVPADLQVATRREGTVTNYEVRVPWALLGLKSFTSKPLYLAVLFNDHDGVERKMVEWFPGIGKSKQPELYSTLVPFPMTGK